jgi:hypothetical protein
MKREGGGCSYYTTRRTIKGGREESDTAHGINTASKQSSGGTPFLNFKYMCIV